MKLHQLRYIREVARCNLNVTDAAELLHTSQPGVSKQIRLLEDELGIPIFSRTGKRLVDVTEPGQAVLSVAERILQEVDNLKKIGTEYTNDVVGTLSIATTHTQARYMLPETIKEFRERYPEVILGIHQGNSSQIVEMAEKGQVDFALTTEEISHSDKLVTLPCFDWNRCLLLLSDHPLLKIERPLTLRDIAQYPIVTYDFSMAPDSPVRNAFKAANLSPNVVLTALDADVIKTYVELDLGIGLVSKLAYEPHRDIYLRMIDVEHLFERSSSLLVVRKGAFLRSYMFEFIELFAPHLTREVVREAISATDVG